jgi:small-conductance mechanosensitive channel
MYQEVGIITAIKKILERFKEEWKQIAVYWVVRFFVWAAGAIMVGLAALILFIVIFLILLIPALMLYFILSALGSGQGSFLFWIVMIPYGLIALVVLIIFLLIVSVPLPVFMKYHLLTFMQKWYPDVRIPLVDPVGAGVQSTT